MIKPALLDKYEQEPAGEPDIEITRETRLLHSRGEHFLGEENIVNPSQGSGLRQRKCRYPGCGYVEKGRKY